MASPQLRSTACRVELVTPDNIRLVFDSRTAQRDLLQVRTHNDMAEACGSFQLTFAPRRIQGRTYDQLIPLRTLVTISMEGPIRTGTKEMSVVMVGLTEDHGIAEDYSRAQPQRVVTITGRSMAGVLLDMELRHFPGLENTAEGTLTVGDHYFNLFIPTDFTTENMEPTDAIRAVLTYFLGVKSHQPALFNTNHVEAQRETQQVKAADPARPSKQIAQDVTRKKLTLAPLPPPARPGEAEAFATENREAFVLVEHQMQEWRKANPGAAGPAIAAEYDQILGRVREAQQEGLLTPKPPPHAQRALHVSQATPSQPLPPGKAAAQVVREHNVLLNLQLPGRSLADLLDLNDDTWTMFDVGVRMPIGHNTPYASTLWNYLKQFIDPVFQEFFTRVEGGVVKIFFRAKPFLEADTFTGTRFIATDPTCRTFGFTREAWEAQYLGGQTRRQTANVYNAFTILPLGATLMWQNASAALLFNPILIDDPHHPSYLAKFGLRVLYDESPYISTKKLKSLDPTQDDLGYIKRVSVEWGKKATAWYELGPEMYAGVLTVLGDPTWNNGHRLLYADARGDREGYIEGVDHSYDYRTGHYTTQLRVTRLWYLSGLVDERGPAGGGTITQEVIDSDGS
jgi:hypothetical protein